MNNDDSTVIKSIYSILETLLVNFLVYFFFYQRQANQEVYLFLNPHPLLFLSLFMGLRYGIKLGVISAVISCLVFIDVYAAIYGNFDLFLTYFRYFKNPLLFLWSAFILGAFKDNHERRINKLSNKIEELSLENKNLQIDFTILEKIQKELKNQIIKSDESIVSLYDIAEKLETFEIEDIYTETIGVLIKYLKATSLDLYTYDNQHDFLRLKIAYGGYEKNNSIEASTCSWFNSVNQYRKVVKTISFDTNEQKPLMAAPLLRDGNIIAVVLIKNMEFDMISEYAFNLFQLIIDWINRTLEKATFVESLLESKYLENTNLVKDSDYFRKRIEVEKRRKKEFNMEYCLFSYRVRELTYDEIDSLVKKTLRSVDIAYFNEERNTLSFLLPATEKKNSYFVEERIKTNFGDNLVKIELKERED